MNSSTAPMWRVQEIYTAKDRHATVIGEWAELYKLDAVKRYVRQRTTDAAMYSGQFDLRLFDPQGLDVTADADLILRAVQLHHAGECVVECPECGGVVWEPRLVSVGTARHLPPDRGGE